MHWFIRWYHSTLQRIHQRPEKRFYCGFKLWNVPLYSEPYNASYVRNAASRDFRLKYRKYERKSYFYFIGDAAYAIHKLTFYLIKKVVTKRSSFDFNIKENSQCTQCYKCLQSFIYCYVFGNSPAALLN